MFQHHEKIPTIEIPTMIGKNPHAFSKIPAIFQKIPTMFQRREKIPTIEIPTISGVDFRLRSTSTYENPQIQQKREI